MYQLGRPTADELKHLTDAYRRDPASGFVALASAFLALGRPRDGAKVAAGGVKSNPDNVEGRMLLGKAFYQLHQWKEAQAQLLRVVKADRNHAEGFALLGEVLMRRGDYERALPVLQHAHNLDPANPGVLVMVKRARSQQALDPPAPIPTPMEPQGAGQPQLPRSEPEFDEAPTNLAPGALLSREDVLGDEKQTTPVPSLHPGPDMVAPQQPAPQQPAHQARPQPAPQPQQAPPPRAKRPSGPPGPPPGGERGRPRVFAPDKRKDAAKESLHQSASVGEDYLNSLLMGGLLDLPNVRAQKADLSVEIGQKWGRSGAKTFVVLFVLLFLGLGSGGAWYYYAEKKKAEAIEQYLARAKTQARTGSYQDLEKAIADANAALGLDKRDLYSMAVVSQILGVSSYLYREVPPARVEQGIDMAATQIDKPGQRGYRELLIARVATTLANLPELESAEAQLAGVRKDLKAHLAENPDDHLARWLSGRAMLAAGDRKGAAAAFEQAAARGDGVILATIDRANMILDEGEHKRALAIYDDVLKKSPDHPLACIGRSLARSERSTESAEAMADLNVCLGPELGPRVEAYKQLALAYANYYIEDYDDFIKNLQAATGVQEPRFLARVALARLLRGQIVAAGKTRASIRWYAENPQPDPLVMLVDAELLYATGDNEGVMEIVGKRKGLRAAKLRGKVYWDQAKYEEAQDEFKTAVDIAPDDLESQVYLAAIKMTTTRGTERRAAEDAIDKLGRRAKNHLPRHVYGEALMRDGKFAKARDEFEKAVEDISEETPHPLAYRSHVALAELDARAARNLLEKEPEEADKMFKSAIKHLNEALKQNPTNYPALDLAGRLLAKNQPEQALQFLISVVDAGAASPYAELTYAELLASSKNKTDEKKAREALERAKKKGVPSEELARVAELVGGEDLAKELVGGE